MDADKAGGSGAVEPTVRDIFRALAVATVLVVASRSPCARSGPIETDEFGYLALIQASPLPMHHTLFLASARVVGFVVGDPYRGFVALDMAVSSLALLACWWWLRALVRPAEAAAGAALMALAPSFWSYGCLAGNYTMIPLVGCALLGLAARPPKRWHPYAAAGILALGTGYRQDIGTFWLPVFGALLLRHRKVDSAGALLAFAVGNLAWLLPMLAAAGGWARYRAASSEFARQAGYLNSIWNLGPIDATLRYAVKAGMATLWTFGPALLFVPRGAARLLRSGRGHLAAMIALSVLPPLGFHGLVHFGVVGYAMHYVPALIALIALGVGREPRPSETAVPRLIGLACLMAALFLFYPTDYNRPGLLGDFDLAFARHTRVGLRSPLPQRDNAAWRTANSTRRFGSPPGAPAQSSSSKPRSRM